MTRFRPCIDLHAGSVKQIVGGTLSDEQNQSTSTTTTSPSFSSTATTTTLKTNFTSELPSSYYASLYKENDLRGGHVIMLGPGNDDAAKEALKTWPGGLQVGGGINERNAREWLDSGAEKVIITSYLFPNARFEPSRLEAVLQAIGNDTSKLVIDLSCRQKDGKWFVAMNKWQTVTEFELNRESLALLAPHCSEFLIHAADVEGLCNGIDHELVARLAEWSPIPVTYAGGGRNIEDLELVKKLSGGKVDLTIGSALDIFGGAGVTFGEVVEWNRAREREERGE